VYKGHVRQISVVLAYVFMIATNIVSHIKGVLPLTEQHFTDTSPTYLDPQPWTYYVWILIFLFQLFFVIYQASPSNLENEDLDVVSLYLMFNFLLNGGYTLIVGYGYLWTGFVVLATDLYVLYQAYQLMQIGLRNDVFPMTKLCEHIPVSLNISWIVIVVVIGFSQVCEANGWKSTQDFAIANIVVTAVISMSVGLTRADLAYALVTIWAYVGIAVKQTHPVNVASFMGIGLCGSFTIIGYIYEKYFQEYDAVGRRISIVGRELDLPRSSTYQRVASRG